MRQTTVKGYRFIVEVNYWPVSTEPDKWMAEIPELPGCRAWGDTPEEAIDIISDFVPDFLPDRNTGDVTPVNESP